MQIDWFTLVAQVLNFLVLVWLLQRFLYGRVVQAMTQREATIAERLDTATRKQTEAEHLAQIYREKNESLEGQREALLTQAREDAESQRRQLIEEVRQEVLKSQQTWLEALRQEQQGMLQDFRERVGQQVFVVARRALKEFANTDLEQQVVAVFLNRLRDLPTEEREALSRVIHESHHEIEIRSSFPIPADLRARIASALREHLDATTEVHYATTPEGSCGIELRADSHRLAWNLESYLEGLEETVLNALAEKGPNHGTGQQSSADLEGVTPPASRP